MARQNLILNRYLVVDQAGAGGYGTVVHAHDTHLKRDVAIKCIKLSEADVARARLRAMEERLQREAGELSAGGLTDGRADERGGARAGEWSGARADERGGARSGEWGGGQVGSRAGKSARRAADQAGGPSDGRAARLSGSPTAREPLPWEDESDCVESELPDALRSAEDVVWDTARRGIAGENAAGLGFDLDGVGRSRSASFADGVDPDEADPDEADVDEADTDELFDHIPGLEEACTVARLNDANIVTVHECVVEGSTAYIIMEYVEGKTLAEVMRDLGDDISLDVIAAVFSSVAHALEVAHDGDVLHLDIKPENVIINKKGVVKVTDFGLATLMDASGQGTTGGGTIGYMPLEQMRQEALDVRTDEWALASLAYEMLSGTNPFRARDLAAAEEAIEESELVLPSLCWEALDAGADDVVFAALDPDPDERYASVAEFAEELMPYLGSTRAGKKALAAVVNEVEPDPEPAAPAPREPLPPIVDRLGPTGAAVLARVFSVAGAAVLGALSLVNMRLNTAAVCGVATDYPLVFWAIMAVLVVLAALRPAFGTVAAFALFAAMLVFNQAFLPGIALLVVTGVWWWRVGRRDDAASTVTLLQPLSGAIGMAAAAPVVAGALLPVREAAATAAYVVVGALALATLGSSNLMNWDFIANSLTAANPSIAGSNLTSAFVDVVTSPMTWCVAVSWVLAAVLYSLFCEKGSRKFDIAGACVAAAVLVVGVVLGTGLESLVAGGAQEAAVAGAGQVVADSAQVVASGGVQAGVDAAQAAAVAGSASVASGSGEVSWLPDPLTLAGALVPGLLGIVLAVMNVPDRVRLEEGEW